MRLAVIALFVVGCGSGSMQDPPPPTSGGPPPATPHSFDEINAQILQPGCAGFSTCHSVTGAAQAGGLDLKTDAYTALFSVMSRNTEAADQSMMRVKPCNPDKSFLVIKLELPESMQDSSQGYGSHMPMGNPSLSEAQISAIRDWIARGAPRTEDAGSTSSCSSP